LQDEERIFWISGKPGAGKSTFMRYVIGQQMTATLINESSPQRQLLIKYFFHGLGTPQEKTLSGMLHGLLRQLLLAVPELIAPILPIYEEVKARSTSSQPSV